MRLFGLFFLVLFLSCAQATEVFTKEDIMKYFNLDNPSVYTAVAQKFIYKEKEKYALGDFDTRLSLEYDKKDYPTTEGEFFSTAIEKPIENGMEFTLAYRRAEGVQEYNNIKTSDDGEFLLGVKVPVFATLNDVNKRKLGLQSARQSTTIVSYEAQNNMRLLYFEAITAYYKLLYFKENLKLVKGLLDNAKKRESIVLKKVEVGSLAKLSILEVKQQIINRKQTLLSTQNYYQNALQNFTKFLNLRSEDFLQKYTLPSMIRVKENYVQSHPTIEEALENRPDLKVFYHQNRKLELEKKFTSVLQYPNLDLGLYGVHDLEYENGFKVTLSMDFPIEQRKYLGKNLEIKKSMDNVNMRKEKKIISIRRNLININNSVMTLENNINNAEFEVTLVEELESAENKKYNVGLSNLFMVNQREIYTLSIKKKLLKYNLDFLILQEELNKIVAKPLDTLF